MHKETSIAIVILNWNGSALFDRFLPSVLLNSQISGVSIYVADNGSTDNSVAFLHAKFPSVKILLLGVNHGFSKGYNLALQQIDADIFILLNSDVEVPANWLQICLQRFENEPRLAALQPKILSFSNKKQFEYAGAAGGFIDHWGYPFCRGRVLSVVETDGGQYDNPMSVFWATGACLFIRAKVFKDAGGFDDDFFAHMEEIDLCWRLKNQGWQIGYEPKSEVYHLGGATLSYQSPRKVYLNFRNNLWMLMKNLPAGKLFPVMFFRMLLDGAASLRFLVTGDFSSLKAVIRAHASFYRNFRRFMEKRAALLKLVKVNSHPEIYNGSIVRKFYIERKQKFTDYRFNP